jgi:hypothetical protein
LLRFRAVGLGRAGKPLSHVHGAPRGGGSASSVVMRVMGSSTRISQIFWSSASSLSRYGENSGGCVFEEMLRERAIRRPGRSSDSSPCLLGDFRAVEPLARQEWIGSTSTESPLSRALSTRGLNYSPDTRRVSACFPFKVKMNSWSSRPTSRSGRDSSLRWSSSTQPKTSSRISVVGRTV